MNLTVQDIHILISIGNSEQPIDDGIIIYFKSHDYINRLHGQTWKQFTDELNNDELINLYKGLVLIEGSLNWIGGSVAGAIWVYKSIQGRRLDTDFKIADFGLRYCDNPWIPFGSSYYGKRTIEDYFAYKEEKSRINTIKAERYEKVLQRVTGRKEKRAAAIAELRKLSREERGNILKGLLEKYATSTKKQRLEIITADLIYPPEYYPVEWINLTPDEIKELPIELRKKLYDKLSTKTKGQWKRFALELKKLDDGM